MTSGAQSLKKRDKNAPTIYVTADAMKRLWLVGLVKVCGAQC
jgi:hypothetical protein